MFDSAAGLGKVFRSEIIPMLKSKGFNLKVATTRKSYYHDGKINVVVDRVPSNFPVWKSEYSRWEKTDNADRLLSTINNRIKILISNNNVELDAKGEDNLDVDIDVEFHRNVPYIPYEDTDDG